LRHRVEKLARLAEVGRGTGDRGARRGNCAPGRHDLVPDEIPLANRVGIALVPIHSRPVPRVHLDFGARHREQGPEDFARERRAPASATSRRARAGLPAQQTQKQRLGLVVAVLSEDQKSASIRESAS